MVDNIELTQAVVHAFDQLLHEEWTLEYEGRLVPAPIVNLADVDTAVKEVDWVVERWPVACSSTLGRSLVDLLTPRPYVA